MAKLDDSKLAEDYQKKTQLEHIKDAPDTYIGSVEKDTIKNFSHQYLEKSNRFSWIFKCEKNMNEFQSF